jgi:hypothetical protein
MTAVQRQILADKPRVTKFAIPWGTNDEDLAAATATTNANVGSGNIENSVPTGDTMENDDLIDDDDEELEDDEEDDDDDDDSEQDAHGNGTDNLAMRDIPIEMDME